MKTLICSVSLIAGMFMSGCVLDIDFDDFFDNFDTDAGFEVEDTETAITPDYDMTQIVPSDGVDVLVVVDNSGSMAEEQQILATGFFTLVNSLMKPLDGPAIESVRVGITTSDMGLQYGDGLTSPNAGLLDSCEAPKGDDGALMTFSATTVRITSNVIQCEEGRGQCPAEFSCVDGYCVAPGGVETVNCMPSSEDFIEGTPASGSEVATQVACLAQQGTSGCGVEQQLSAATRAARRNAGFLVDSHALQVIIVSDENDCSLENDGLFMTPEWLSGASEYLNVACNYPSDNEEYLFSPVAIRNMLIEAKGVNNVLFAAIVGVANTGCEGSGNEIGDCLAQPEMEISINEFHTPEGWAYVHFNPACERIQGNTVVTSARPGRRMVETAMSFGPKGYISSICNADWSPAMADIAENIFYFTGM